MEEKKNWSWNKHIANAMIFVLSVGGFALANSFAQGNGFIISENRQQLYPIGFYELPKSDADLATMANAGINLVRCTSREDLDRLSRAGMMGSYPLNLS